MWTLEQNPVSGEPEYIFSGMESGIGDSPYAGISFMSGLDIKNSPKVAYSNIARAVSTMNFGLAQPAEQINYTIQDPQFLSNLYSVTCQGIVRQSVDAGKTWTALSAPSGGGKVRHGNGLFIYNSWLHVVGDDSIDACAVDVTGTTGSWVTTMANVSFTKTQNYGQNHYSIVGRDAIVYMCNGNYVASIITTGAYRPDLGTGYTFNDTALGLPLSGYYTGNYGVQATYLCELQTNLLVAYGNQIIPWDRTSTSYGIPFPFPEFIAKMININNTIYCFGGVPTYFNHSGGDYSGIFSSTNGDFYNPVASGRGNIYYYNGFSGDFLKSIPDHLASTYPTSQEPKWLIGGISSYLNKIIFGAMDYNGNTYNGNTGVFSLDVSTQSQAIQYQVAPSPLTIKNAGGFPTAICSTTNTLVNSNILSYSTGVTIQQGIASGGYYYNYTDQAGNREQGLIKTDILQIGTHLQNKTFNTIEVRFRNPLSAGETVQVYSYKYFGGSTSTSDQTNFTYTAPTASKELSFTCPTVVQNNEEIELYLITNPIQNGSGIPIKEIILR